MNEPEFDNHVRVAIYRNLADGSAAPVSSEIAAALGTSPARVEEAFHRLHDGHVLVLAPGTPYIWMANPFSALPTPYTAAVAGKTYWGNCIWDAMGIVAMLGSDGAVVASCPDCGDELRLDMRDGEIQGSDYVVHYAVPARQWWDDIGFN